MTTRILGISAYYHDSAACLLEDGRIVAAAQEERFTRKKHDAAFPGGVALNCVANGRILREGPFDQVWVQPAAGDAGGALGVALALWHRFLDRPRTSAETSGQWERPSLAAGPRTPRYADAMSGSFLGPRFGESEIEACIERHGYVARRVVQPLLAEEIAALLAKENVIGLLQGRMEFGPRALGGRSIIADARSTRMQSLLDLKTKFRESFRPFAPSVLRDHVASWFELEGESPYMLLVADVSAAKRPPVADEAGAPWGIEKLNVPRSLVPAITHVDYSARIQTVRREVNPVYYDLSCARQTMPCAVSGVTHMDVLVLENFILERSKQGLMPVDHSWQEEFVLD